VQLERDRRRRPRRPPRRRPCIQDDDQSLEDGSTDNVGVTGYEICHGALLATVGPTRLGHRRRVTIPTSPGLDAAGNSPASAPTPRRLRRPPAYCSATASEQRPPRTGSTWRRSASCRTTPRRRAVPGERRVVGAGEQHRPPPRPGGSSGDATNRAGPPRFEPSSSATCSASGTTRRPQSDRNRVRHEHEQDRPLRSTAPGRVLSIDGADSAAPAPGTRCRCMSTSPPGRPRSG
jgi:hypothetical protein